MPARSAYRIDRALHAPGSPENLHRCCGDAVFFTSPMSQKYREASALTTVFALGRRGDDFNKEINCHTDTNHFTIANIFSEHLFWK